MKKLFYYVATSSKFVNKPIFSIKKLKNKGYVILTCLTLLLLTISCNVTPELTDLEQPEGITNLEPINKDIIITPILLSKIWMDKVDLYLDLGPNTTGTVTVEIRDSSRTTIIGSSTVSASSLITTSPWKTFTFSPTLALTKGKKYTINVTRSDPHDYNKGNYVFWMCSAQNTNPYTEGTCDPGSYWNLDYAFKTYKSGIVDQQQPTVNYGFFVSSGFYRWQEFKADFYKIILNKVDLHLYVGSATTGTITIQIRNSNGSSILASSTKIASFLLTGSNWNSFTFSGVTLYSNTKYRLYVTRSDAHNYSGNNYIFWDSSSGGTDAYPGGVNDVYPSWTLDYAFRTYSSTGLDQQQNLSTYGFFTSSGLYRWQEFNPVKP